MRFCHLLVFVDDEKKAPLDIDWCIRSACLSKMEEGGMEVEGVMEKRQFLCFVVIFNWFVLHLQESQKGNMYCFEGW